MSVKWQEPDEEPMTFGEILSAVGSVAVFFGLLYGGIYLCLWLGHLAGRI